MANTNIRPRAAVADRPPFAAPPSGNTRLGLHVTSDELAIWQDRAVNGPYKTTGDVSSGSLGDWDRIVSRKNTFNTNPAAVRWNGQVSNQSWHISPPGIDNQQALNMLAAAFYSLVANDATTKTNVHDELIAQAGVTGTNFGDTTRWPTISGGEDGWIHDYASWLIRLLHSYDYTKAAFSGAEQTTMDTWFLNAANYMDKTAQDLITVARFPNRYSNDYSVDNYGSLGANQFVIFYGGPIHGDWHEGWNNRAALLVCFAGLVGIMQNNSTLISHTTRWCKEALSYCVFCTDSNTTFHIGDYHRWVDGYASNGWAYSVDFTESIQTFADALARTGDYTLYAYSTSVDYRGTGSAARTLQDVINTNLKYVVPDITHYGTSVAGNQNATYRVDTEDPTLVPGGSRLRDICGAITNIYYNDANNKSIYMRTKAGCPAYPTTNLSWDEVGEGPRALFPGILFMWGQLEGVVDPYP